MDENFEEKENPNSPSSFENLDKPSPYNNPEPQFTPTPRRRSPKKFLYILIAVVIILILINLVRFIGSKGKSSKPSPTPTSISLPTSTPVSEASSSPTPVVSSAPKPSPVSSIDKTTGLDRTNLSVSVQNGSGAAGVAQKAADILKSLGYKVTSTGNADNFNYTNVTIKVKAPQKDYLPVLNKDLSSNGYSIGTTSSDLTATASADALVIVGK